MDLGNQRQSANVEYATENPASGFFRWMHSIFRPGERDVHSRENWPAPRDQYTGPNTANLRGLMDTMDEPSLRASAEEVRNLYNLRNNPEAFNGYLHDLDSRGLGLSYEPVKAGPMFVLRTHDRDFFGNEIPQETLAESRRLVQRREAETAVVIRENNAVGMSLGTVLDTRESNSQTSVPDGFGPPRR